MILVEPVKTLQEIVKAKLLAPNTLEWFDARGCKFIRYYDTDVVVYDCDKITLNSGGLLGRTTKDRINAALPRGMQVHAVKGVWMLTYYEIVKSLVKKDKLGFPDMNRVDKWSVPFYDGMEIIGRRKPRAKSSKPSGE